MRLRNVLFTSLLLALVTGCVGPKANVQSVYVYTPEDRFALKIQESSLVAEDAMHIFEKHLDSRTSKLKIDDAAPTRLVTIEFTSYRPRHAAALHTFGLVGGGDTIRSVTTIEDAQSGLVLGIVEHTTNNPQSTVGLNSTIRTHADQIADYVLTGEVR